MTVCATRRGENGGFVNRGPLQRCRPDPETVGQMVLDIMTGGVAGAERHPDESTSTLPDESAAAPTFNVGDRVVDVFGNHGVVTHVDPAAEHGMGVIRVRYDDGRQRGFALVASGLQRVD